MVFVFSKYDANIPQPKRPVCDICHTSTLIFMTNGIFLAIFDQQKPKRRRNGFLNITVLSRKNNPPWMLSSLSRLS